MLGPPEDSYEAFDLHLAEGTILSLRGFSVQDLGFRQKGLGFRVQGLGFKVWVKVSVRVGI